MFKNIILSFVLVALVGCASSSPKQQQGTLLGGMIGVGLGSLFGKGSGNTTAMIAGGLIGALAGSDIGRQLDDRDRMLAKKSTYNALEYSSSGVKNNWENPDSGHTGYTVAKKAYVSNEQYCREFTQVIYVGGKKETGYGTACRQSDGTWEIQ